jgi:hypothetical protein
MACGFNIRCAYGSWLDHHPWAAVALAAPARIVGHSDRHPTAALAWAVPGTIIALAAVATYPLVFVPLVVLVGVALVASVRYEEIRDEENRRDPTCWRADCPDMHGRRKVPDSH